MKDTEFITEQLLQSREVLSKFIQDQTQLLAVTDAAYTIAARLMEGHKIIAIGNGGSQSDAAHFAAELTGKFRQDRKSLPALTVSDAAHLTCVSNDFGYDQVFSRFLQAHGQIKDVLLAISTSGNSTNVINAVYTAKAIGMEVIALTGDSITSELSRVPRIQLIQVPSTDTRLIQEVHIKIIHVLVMMIERGMGL